MTKNQREVFYSFKGSRNIICDPSPCHGTITTKNQTKVTTVTGRNTRRIERNQADRLLGNLLPALPICPGEGEDRVKHKSSLLPIMGPAV